MQGKRDAMGEIRRETPRLPENMSIQAHNLISSLACQRITGELAKLRSLGTLLGVEGKLMRKATTRPREKRKRRNCQSSRDAGRRNRCQEVESLSP